MTTELTKRFELWYGNNLLSAPVHQSDQDRAREAFMAGAEAQALTQRPAAQTERDTGPRVLREVFALCEDTVDKMTAESTEFSRGRAFEAKGIARAIGTWFQDEYCGQSHMGEPSLPAPQQATPEWLHLKSYGYAPGNYMSKCLRCGQTPAGLDKRATSCRPCAEAAYADQQATPEPSRGMIGMGAHALANELAQAVAQDDADPDGHDMSAGLFGPNVSAWLRKVAAEYLSKPATPEPVHHASGMTADELWLQVGRLRAQMADAGTKATPEPVGEQLQGGLDNDALLNAWLSKLPGVTPTDAEMTAFALGVEVGFAHARTLERSDWSRVHEALQAAGVHPGRTDDHLADVIAKALANRPAPGVPAEGGEAVK